MLNFSAYKTSIKGFLFTIINNISTVSAGEGFGGRQTFIALFAFEY